MGFMTRLVVSLLAAFLIAVSFHQREGHRHRLYDEWIWEASVRYSIDPLLIKAVIWRETDFDPSRFGRAQERGLMQVTPVAGKEWAEANKIRGFRPESLADPRTSVFAGAWYLARALERWKDRDNPVPFALAEYNAGRTHARRWAAAGADGAAVRTEEFLERIDFPTTRAYVEAILERHDRYRAVHGVGGE